MGVVTFRRTSKFHPTRKTLFYLREFINFPQRNTHAYVLAECSQSKEGNTPWITLEMADCSSTVSFDFHCGNRADLENTLYKLEVLRTAIVGLENAVKEALPDIKKDIVARERRNRQQLARLEAQQEAGTLSEDDQWTLERLRRSVSGDDD